MFRERYGRQLSTREMITPRRYCVVEANGDTALSKTDARRRPYVGGSVTATTKVVTIVGDDGIDDIALRLRRHRRKGNGISGGDGWSYGVVTRATRDGGDAMAHVIAAYGYDVVVNNMSVVIGGYYIVCGRLLTVISAFRHLYRFHARIRHAQRQCR